MKTKAKGCRRNFLKQLAIMGWAGALASLSGKAKADELNPGSEPETAAGTTQGYRETSHVRKYYEKASF
jgi:hypothetical protein